MIYIGNIKKYCNISDISVAKPKISSSLLSHSLYEDFSLNFCVDSDEAMKRDDEALTASLNQYFRNV
jgi:hypothetical protein